MSEKGTPEGGAGGGVSVTFRDTDERSAWDGYAAGALSDPTVTPEDAVWCADTLLLERRKREPYDYGFDDPSPLIKALERLFQTPENGDESTVADLLLQIRDLLGEQ